MFTILLEERERVHEQLCQWIEDDPRRLAVLADLVIAIPLSRSLQSPDLAENIIRDIQIWLQSGESRRHGVTC